MSNAYCSLTQLGWFFDTRSSGMLSNDANSKNADVVAMQALLDTAAAELESHLSGRVALPLTEIPLMLTRWVAAKTAQMHYGRRGGEPKQIASLIEWADKWITDFDKGKISLDGVMRVSAPRADEHPDCAQKRMERQLIAGLNCP